MTLQIGADAKADAPERMRQQILEALIGPDRSHGSGFASAPASASASATYQPITASKMCSRMRSRENV